MTDRVWLRTNADWVDIDGEVVALSDGNLSRLDPSSSLVWRLLDEPAEERDLASVIARWTGAAQNTVVSELSTLLDELAGLGLVRRLAK